MHLREPDHALELPCRRRDALLVRARVFTRFAERDVAADKFVTCGLSNDGVDTRASIGDVSGELL